MLRAGHTAIARLCYVSKLRWALLPWSVTSGLARSVPFAAARSLSAVFPVVLKQLNRGIEWSHGDLNPKFHHAMVA